MSSVKIERRQQYTDFELPVLDRVLNTRGISHPSQIDYQLKSMLPPNGLSNIDDAAELLAEAVQAQAKIVIVGDFDADGATSCAVAIRALQSFGLEDVSFLVPNRFEFGYGLSPEIVGVAAVQQPDVIITVDNGISSIDGVNAAQALGISVLVTDHHLPGDNLPTADVIVNPNLPNDRFASKSLAGVGVIFYVMLAVRAKLRQQGWFQQMDIAEPNMSQLLDYVALGTVADVVPLDHNNRILVQQGLQRIRAGKACFGINALLEVAKRDFRYIASEDLGFAVGPRLNAAGRMDDMSVGIACLLATSQAEANQLAQQLDNLNKSRRETEDSMRQEAAQLVKQLDEENSIKNNKSTVGYCLHNASWHQGIVGLVAGRVKERVRRPVAALAPADIDSPHGEWKGSIRSVEGIHIRDVLARIDALYPDTMLKFGGHAMAAGLSIQADNIEAFAQYFDEVLREFAKGMSWQQVIESDGELAENEFNLNVAEQLRYSTPWGSQFPAPVFDGFFEVVDARVVGDSHAKMLLRPRDSDDHYDAICFGYLRDHEHLPVGIIHAAYRLDINHYQGMKKLQLMIYHIVRT
jgi:single-stranded-DNA-specific exonuclease